ncbi:MAG: hypothetical protein O2782_19030 [bacterium]|nr:hypothetical protein [bacterium]
MLGDSPRDACYVIEAAISAGPGRMRLDLGDTTLVRGFVDPQNYAAGVLYDVAVGDGFEILSVVRCCVSTAGCEVLHANVDLEWRREAGMNRPPGNLHPDLQ